METHEAFLQGIKPTFLCSHRYEKEILDKLFSKKYPNILYYELEDFDEPGTIFDRGTLFFRTEHMKNEYITKAAGLRPHSREEIIFLGETLGYPPIACEFFADARHDKNLDAKRAAFDYYGIRFGGNIDDVEKITEWLWSNIPAPPAAVEVTYQKETRIIEPAVVTT